jgi:hypothetical protein
MAVDWRDPKFEDIDLSREQTCARKAKSYKSKAEARRGASVVGRRLNVRMYPYECGFCGRWHLSKIDPATERRNRHSNPWPTDGSQG